MASFSLTEAAFTGFRVVREHPKAVIGWAILQFVLTLVSMLILAQMAGPAMARLQTSGLPNTTDAILALASQLAPAEFATLLVSLLIDPVIYAAMNRIVLSPADERFCYVRLGADELRQLALKLLFLALLMAALVGLSVIMTVIETIGAALGSAGQMVVSFALFASVGGAVGGLVYVAARLSLASAATFATRRVDLRTSWTLTRGRVWPILGAMGLALAMSAVVFGLGVRIITSIMDILVGGMSGAPGTFQADLSSVSHFLQPLQLAYVVLIALLYGLMSPLLVTPPALIYQRLTAAAGQPQGARPQATDIVA